MRAAAVVRYEGANGAGHVGWGFDSDLGQVNCGSVENPSGKPSCSVDRMGYWDAVVANPIPEFTQRNYVDIKFVDLSTVDVNRAIETAKWVAEQPYSVIGRNCLDDVYDVLRAYGVLDLPPPSHDWLPNEWFGMWPGNGASARLASFAWPPQHPDYTEETATFFKSIVRPLTTRAKEPAWRTPGTPEWHDLQEKLAAVSSRAPYRLHVGAPSNQSSKLHG